MTKWGIKWKFIWILLAITTLLGCTSPGTPATNSNSVVKVPVMPNDSIVAAEIVSVKPLTGGFAFEMEIRLTDSQNLPGSINMTKDKVGQVLTAKTQDNLVEYKAADLISGNLRFAGDERGAVYILSQVSKISKED